MNSLVVPTIREDCIKRFLREWEPHYHWDKVYVVEDNPSRTFDLDRQVTHLCWENIDQYLREDSWIISRRDSGIKCFGIWLAWKSGAEHIYLLDDDCLPYSSDPKDFLNEHWNGLYQWERWTESVPGWRTRGIPYKNKGKLDTVMLNHGLWANNPDLDACQTLAGPEWNGLKGVRCKHRLMPHGQYFPMCGMNVCFRREIAPVMYFPLMGEGVPFNRFDDIWCGIIMKKVCDHLGYHVACGNPLINHEKASDPFKNLVREATGIAASEWFWETIDNIKLTESTPAACMREIGAALPQEDEYLEKLGRAIQVWSSLYQSIE